MDMIPVQFDYAAPATLEDALARLASRKNAVVMAGGQALIPNATLGRVTPGLVVDLAKIASLKGIQARDGGLRIGAMTTLADLAASADVARRYPALAEAVAGVSDPQVRNRATVGGTLADAHPGSDFVAVALALGSTINVTGATGTRAVAADDFVTGPHATALEPGEIITSLDVPAPAAGGGSAYARLGEPGGGYAICGVAAVIQLDGSGKVTSARVALTGAAERPARVSKAEAALQGKAADAKSFAQAGAAVADAGLTFRTDLFASREYRAHLAAVLVERALAGAAGRAKG